MDKDLLIVQGFLVAGYRVDAKDLDEDEKPYPSRLDSEIVYLKDAEVFQNGRVVAVSEILGVRFEQIGAISAGSVVANVFQDEEMYEGKQNKRKGK